MQKIGFGLIAIVAIALIVVSQSLFIVDQREQAILLQLGQPVGDSQNPDSFIKGPGLHFKIPMIQDVVYFDRRILSVDPDAEQVVISSATLSLDPLQAVLGNDQGSENNSEDNKDEKDIGIDVVTGEPIILDTFVRYKIVDPLQFFKTLRTIREANSKIENILIASTRAELGKTSLEDLLSPTRTQVMASIQRRVNTEAKNNRMGVEIVDARIVRADLTPALRNSTVERMQSELKERATETVSKGKEKALEILSTARKERTVLLAEAQRDSEIIRGEGDNEAFQTYAKAFNKDKDFYSFLRSMEAYRNTFGGDGTQMILSPNSDFLRFFQNSGVGTN